MKGCASIQNMPSVCTKNVNPDVNALKRSQVQENGSALPLMRNHHSNHDQDQSIKDHLSPNGN